MPSIKKKKKQVNETETCEFLKFIKYNEYNMAEQLNKMPSRISLLSLLLNFEPNQDALLKVLNQAYVTHNISVDKIDHLVGNILADNFISFNDNEIPPDGIGSTKTLHISTNCKNYILLRVLIDNGSSQNMMLMTTLSRLPVEASHMKQSHTMVKVFYGT